MEKNIYSYLFIAVVAIAFISCKKDNDNHYTVKLLKTITHISATYGDKYDEYKFEYDEQNRITKFYNYFSTSTFTYEEDDLVKVISIYSSGNDETYEYTKSSNTITQKYTYDGVFVNSYIIELNSDGLPVKLEEEQPGIYPIFEIYEYKEGNLTKRTECILLPEYNYEERECHSYTYEYDNHKGALYYCQTPKWYLILHLNDFGIKNNVTYSGGTSPPRTAYAYKYDNSEFPVERTCKSSGYMQNGEWVEEFTYIKK